MRFPLSQEISFFDKNSLHFNKQDTVFAVLLVLFFLLFPFTALLPYSRASLGILLLIPLYLSARRGIAFRMPPAFFLFEATALAGLLKPYAARDTLLFFLLSLAFFIPSVPTFSICRLTHCLALASGVCGTLAIIQQLSGKSASHWSDAERFGALARAGAVFSNPNVLGIFLAVGVILSLDAIRVRLSAGGASLYLLTLLLSLGGLLFTYSRGAWLGAGCGILLYAVRLAHPKRRKETAHAFIPVFAPLARVASLFSPDSSMLYRLSLWKSTLSASPLRLLFGAGEGRRALFSLLTPTLASGLERIEHTHSLYLHLLCAEGVFGLMLFLILALSRLSDKRVPPCISGAILSILVYGIFDDPLYSGQIGVLLWLLLGVGYASTRST